jgi:hypothetical protein
LSPILPNPPLKGDFAVGWEDGQAWIKEDEKEEKRQMEMVEQGGTEVCVEEPWRRWIRRR